LLGPAFDDSVGAAMAFVSWIRYCNWFLGFLLITFIYAIWKRFTCLFFILLLLLLADAATVILA
jgi:hypothetical protein